MDEYGYRLFGIAAPPPVDPAYILYAIIGTMMGCVSLMGLNVSGLMGYWYVLLIVYTFWVRLAASTVITLSALEQPSATVHSCVVTGVGVSLMFGVETVCWSKNVEVEWLGLFLFGGVPFTATVVSWISLVGVDSVAGDRECPGLFSVVAFSWEF